MNRMLVLLLCAMAVNVYADQIKCDAKGEVTITSDTKLDNSCVYNIQVDINSSNISLDCDGAVLDGEKNESIPYGVLVDSQGKALENITIKNCTFRNYFKNGILVGWKFSDTGKLKLANQNRDEMYARTPKNVKIANTVVENAQRVGIFIDDYVSGTELSGVSVLNGREVAIYLEHDSRNTTLKNSTLEGNGQWGSRESLAIDASSNNEIIGNTFKDNSTGGVFLYKNCWEWGDQNDSKFFNPNSPPRTQGANGNVIRNNKFINTGLAVYIASRQDKPLNNQHCGDPLMYTAEASVFKKESVDKYYEDYAQNNSVEKNEIECSTGIYVADDNNQVIDNHFADNCGTQEIKLGSAIKGVVYGQPVQGNKIDGNTGAVQINVIGNAKP